MGGERERVEIYGGRVGGSDLEREVDFLKRWKKTESLDDCYHRTYTNNENEYIVIELSFVFCFCSEDTNHSGHSDHVTKPIATIHVGWCTTWRSFLFLIVCV